MIGCFGRIIAALLFINMANVYPAYAAEPQKNRGGIQVRGVVLDEVTHKPIPKVSIRKQAYADRIYL